MQTKLSPEFRDSAEGRAAESILRSCVHCGFCNATCPTYQVRGDELDGPRGRIYLIKQMLEGGAVSRSTQEHLDRCLTCLNCQTTCPSGVEYGKLVAIGRALSDARVARPPAEKWRRWLLREGLTSPLFPVLLTIARRLRGILPEPLRVKVPARPAVQPSAWPKRQHRRKVLLLAGCVQPAMMPNINGATARVLDAIGIQTLVAAQAGCCGALREHLSDPEGALVNARRNIDAWWTLVETGTVEAVVMNSSACGLAVKHYGEALAADERYRDKAKRISAITRDLSEYLPEMGALAGRLRADMPRQVCFHAPCTLQHGQRIRGTVEQQLSALGFDVQVPNRDPHLCCGSAGTYSLLEPAISRALRDRKLATLTDPAPEVIVSANVGCINHLQSGTTVPVRHWIEVLDAAIA